MSEVKLSALAKGIEERGRRGDVVDCSRFVGLGGKPFGEAFVQVPVVGEEIDAVGAAHVVAGKATIEAARKDPDLLDNAKGVEIVWRAFRDNADRRYPLFPGPDWMRSHMTSDEVGACLNIMAEVRRASGPDPSAIDGATVLAIAETCTRTDKLAEGVLAGLSREQVTAAFVLLAVDWARRGVEVEALKAGVPALSDDGPKVPA